MNISFKSVALAVPFVAVLGAVYWVGSTVGFPEGAGGISPVAASASPDVAHAPMNTSVPAIVTGDGKDSEKPVPQKVQMTEAEKKTVLARFFSAAERDVQRMEMEISKSKLSGMAVADIVAMEEKLAKMRQVIQQVKLRNPGY